MQGLKLALLVGSTIALTMAPSPAQAAPSYVTSQPEDEEKMGEAPEEIRIVFNQPLDPDGTLLVIDECKKSVDDGNVVIAGNTISVGTERSPSGLYVAAWRVKAPGGVGGEATGQIEFTVTSGKSCGPATLRGGGHEGHDGGGGNGGGHGGQDHDSGSGEHSDHTSDAASGDHDAHGTTLAAGTPDHGSQHGNGNDHGTHGKRGKGADKNGNPVAAAQTDLASPVGDLVDPVSGSVALASLLVALIVGAAGGWMIRTINP